MPNTYSQISIHSVFAVKGRENLITGDWRNELHKYIAGIITGYSAKPLAVGGWKDHVHIFFGMPVTTCISDFMSIVKANSRSGLMRRVLLEANFNSSPATEPSLIQEARETR